MVDYSEFLENKLNEYGQNLIEAGYKIKVFNERAITGGYTEEIADLLGEDGNIYFRSDTIYVVIKYLKGSIYLDSTEIPIVIYAYSENGSFDLTKQLIDNFAQNNNLEECEIKWIDEQNTITSRLARQTFSTPVIQDNFLNIGPTFKSMIQLTGNLSIFFDVNDIKELYNCTFDENGNVSKEKIEFYQSSIAWHISPDTQPSISNKYSKTIPKFAYVTLTLSVPFKQNNDFNNIVLKHLSLENGKEQIDARDNISYWEDKGNMDSLKPFYFKIVMKSGFIIRWVMYLNNIDLVSVKGGLPTLSLVFGY